MEQSALRLKIEKDKSITSIGFNYGYDSANFSSAFKNHLRISPAQFRKLVNTTNPSHPLYPDRPGRYKSFDELDRQISLQELDDFFVIYERRIGNYLDLGENWCDFTEKYEAFLTEDTLLIERSYDDPTITSVDQCLYDICMTVDKDCCLENVMTIRGGKFAVFRF